MINNKVDNTNLIQERADLIKASTAEINKTKSLTEVYDLMDKLNESVKIFYSHIGCKNECFLCCQNSNIPTATSLEWSYLYEFILKSSDDFKKNIIDTNQKLFATHGSYLKRIHFALNNDDEEFKLNELYDTLPKFKGKSCVFLKEGSCSVYDSRPGKCRTQGYSLMQFANNVQFQTCLPENIKMEELLSKQGNRKVLMPIWNDYEKHIQDLSDSEKIIFSVLPVWLFSHTKDNMLVDQLNTSPDFEAILSNF